MQNEKKKRIIGSHKTAKESRWVPPPALKRGESNDLELYHNIPREDPYRWLEDKKSHKVKHVIEEENQYVESFFQQHHPNLRKQLFQEMKSRWKENETSIPVVSGPYWYYTRFVPNAEYPIHCRRPYSLKDSINIDFLEELRKYWKTHPFGDFPFYSDEEVFFDPNLLLFELEVDALEIGEMDFSPDHRQLAVMIDLSEGEEVYTLFIFEVCDVNVKSWLAHSCGKTGKRGCMTEGPNTGDNEHQSIYEVLLNEVAFQHSSSTIHSSCSESRTNRKSKTTITTSGKCKSFSGTKNSSHTSRRAFLIEQAKKKFVLGKRSEERKGAGASLLPHHRLLHRISQFSMGAEVMWIGPQALLYVGLDETLRPYQLIYHDLTITPVENPLATVVCFEEEEEAFGVGNLCTTADGLFLMFDASSEDISVWYVCPLSLKFKDGVFTSVCPLQTSDTLNASRPTHFGQRRFISGIPVVMQNLEKYPLEEYSGRSLASVTCVRPREGLQEGERLTYDVEHSWCLLGPSRGGWIVVSNLNNCTNFTLFCVPDQPFSALDSQELMVVEGSTFSNWLPLCAYDELLKVEGVDISPTFILVSVRRRGIATTLFSPITVLWNWWQQAEPLLSEEKGNREALPTLQWSSFLDLSVLLRPVWDQLVTPKNPSDLLPDSRDSLFFNFNVWEEIHAGREARQPHTLLEPNGLSNGETSLQEAFLRSSVVASPLPLTVECSTSHGCDEFGASRFRACLTHLLHPLKVFSLVYTPSTENILNGFPGEESREWGSLSVQLIREERVKGGYDPSLCDGAVVWVPSNYYAHTTEFGPSPSEEKEAADYPLHAELLPTRDPSPERDIPVYLLWRKDLHRKGANPLLLHVYGSYGECCELDFSSERLSLLDRGFIWGNAAVRGGGDFGTFWRDEGRKLQRGTTVNDFLSVSKYCQDVGVCEAGKLISYGGSAGGLVVCRAMNAAPHLFHAVIGAVPFVDCLSTLLRAELPLTVTDWEEFGNPIKDPEVYRLVAAISPVDTIPPAFSDSGSDSTDTSHQRRILLPHVFLETFWNDTRVRYWESLKLAAHLRHRAASLNGDLSCSALVLHQCIFEKGHTGSSGCYEQLLELAGEYAFALLITSSPEYFENRKAIFNPNLPCLGGGKDRDL